MFTLYPAGDGNFSALGINGNIQKPVIERQKPTLRTIYLDWTALHIRRGV